MDARSLLRAKRAEARIQHPYASYSASGQLRCSVCAVPVKQWDAHLLTKQHRTSVAREKAQAQAAVQANTAKRPAEETPMLGESSKRAKLEEKEKVGPRGLPAGFFSSANRPVDEEEEDREDAAGPLTASAAMTSAPAPVPTGDAELDDFLASLAEPEPEQPEPTRGKVTATASRRGVPAYKDLIPGQASYEAAPVRIVSGEEAKEEETEPEESEAERRARLGREEREEIMGRLEEEERAQEDADSRVTMLKARVEALKKRREAKAGESGGAKATDKVNASKAGANGDS